MSVNCIRCVKRRRTGLDLLCDECRAEAKAHAGKPMPEEKLQRMLRKVRGEEPIGGGAITLPPLSPADQICNCGPPLNGSHDHTTCGPPIIVEDTMLCEICGEPATHVDGSVVDLKASVHPHGPIAYRDQPLCAGHAAEARQANTSRVRCLHTERFGAAYWADDRCPSCGSDQIVNVTPATPGPTGWGGRCKACGKTWSRDERAES